MQDYFVQLDKENSKIVKGFVKLKGNEISNNEVEIRIPDLGVNKKFKTDKKGVVEFNFETTNVNYWSPENPTLYNVELKTSEDQVNDLIGFRSIKTEGTSILLNDKKIFLKGISIHEENPIRGGRAYSKEDAELLLGWAKELGCNFVRLAHYPHNENMIRIADKLGILVWEEIPVYWTIDWENKETYQNALNQLSEVISRDKNRAATIIWSVSNETPNSDARFTFLSNLAQTARQLDQTRLISSALEVSNFDNDPNLKTIHDPFAAVVDVLSFNAYVGWYDGLPDKCKKVNWKIDIDKPVIISEFGGGAKYGFHADSLTRWSEEYQEYLYKENIKMFERLPQLSGMTPWILTDFRSPR
ncbi:MAG: beta-glucuronidase, partial [Ignavibacteriae bacterium]|nr:beta-glucuronidase [Ignavibacteriota bacterium]